MSLVKRGVWIKQESFQRFQTTLKVCCINNELCLKNNLEYESFNSDGQQFYQYQQNK